MNPLNIQQGAHGIFVTYKLCPNESLDRMTMGMLRNNNIKGIVPVDYSQIDQEKWLKYNVKDMVTMNQYLSGVLTRKKALDIFHQVTDVFVLAEDYMIDASFLILDGNYVFVNPNTTEIGIICLPLSGFVANLTLRDFVANVTRSAQFNPQENSDYVMKILNYVNGTGFSVDGFKKILNELHVGSVERIQRPVADTADANGQMAVTIESVASMVSNNMDPGTQGIWGAGSGKRSPQGQAVNLTPPVQPNSPPKKEKKGLFGKKKKPEKAAIPPSPASGGMAIPGMAAPGMAVPGMNIPGEPGMAIPAGNEPAGGPAKGKKPIQATKTGKPETTVPPVATGNPVMPEKAAMMGKPIPPAKQVKPAKPVPPGKPVMPGGAPGSNLSDIAAQINVEPKRQTTSAKDKPEWSISPEYQNGVGVSDGTINLRLNTEPPAVIRRVRTGETATVENSQLVIGKDRNNVDFCIEHNTTISRVHAKIIKRGNQYYIQDNNSMNHTYVNGVQVLGGQEQVLENGCSIRLSDEDFIFTTS